MCAALTMGHSAISQRTAFCKTAQGMGTAGPSADEPQQARQAPRSEVVASGDTAEGQVEAPQAAMAAEEGGSCHRCQEMGHQLQELEIRMVTSLIATWTEQH
ncbi:UNVERIFIED_CONTAM: hypothetical protein K2H54_054973 [Gekko kuhli]